MKRVLLCLLTLALSIPSIHAEREAESLRDVRFARAVGAYDGSD